MPEGLGKWRFLVSPRSRVHFWRKALGYVLFFALSPFLALGPRIRSEQKKAVIFDLGGVLIDTDTMGMMWHTGPFKFVQYMINNKSPEGIEQKLFDFLRLIETQNNHQTILDKRGNKLPQIMCDWLTGKQSSSVIYQCVVQKLNENKHLFTNAAERRLVKALARTIFTPKIFARTRKLIKENIKLVTECKKHGYQVFVLSNWDAESFALLQKKYTSFFKQFDDVVISGDAGYLKPDKKLYKHLMKEHNLHAHDCILLDDQQENIKAAQSLGITGIHVTPDKACTTRIQQILFSE